MVTHGAGGLLHHRFTLTLRHGDEHHDERRFVFCGTVPRVAPGGCYPPPCHVEPGLSSTTEARFFNPPSLPRSPGRLVRRFPIVASNQYSVRVLVLLPPSEGKTPAASGTPLSLASLSFPSLTDTRSVVVKELVSWCAAQPGEAQSRLGLSDRLAHEIDRNAQLRSAPCSRAISIYTGVLYDALSWPTLTPTERARGQRSIAIASSLFGLLRPLDAIPAYRLPPGVTLPQLGRLKPLWHEHISTAVMSAEPTGVIVDMRSSAYATMGPIPTPLLPRTVVVRALAEGNGKRTVVSHHNKFIKGLLVRDLLACRAGGTVVDVARILSESGRKVDVVPPANASRPWTLNVITTDEHR